MTHSADIFWPEADPPSIRLAYDVQLRRPGCVIVQATVGAGRDGARACQAFDCRHWLLAPTPGMQVMTVTRDQFHQLVDMSLGKHGPGRLPVAPQA